MAEVNTPAELSIIGIDCAEGPPSLSNFPKGFNRAAFDVWKAVLDSPSYKRRSQEPGNKTCDRQWLIAVRLYFKFCRERGAHPFQTSTQQSRNDIVATTLTSQRRKIARLFNDNAFFKKVSIQRVERSYTFTQSTFTLTAIAYLRPTNDPTFRSWLSLMKDGPYLMPTGGKTDNKLERQLSSATKVFVNFRNPTTAEVGYSITVNTLPAWPTINKVPTQNQLRDFVEQVFWKPAVRSHRIKDIGPRFF